MASQPSASEGACRSVLAVRSVLVRNSQTGTQMCAGARSPPSPRVPLSLGRVPSGVGPGPSERDGGVAVTSSVVLLSR